MAANLMRRGALTVAIAAVAALAASFVMTSRSRADVVVTRDVGRRSTPMAVRLGSVSLTRRSQAPADDQRRAEREIRSALSQGQARIDRCLEGYVLDDDPLHHTSRVLVGRIAFDRSARPTGSNVGEARGVPPRARQCIGELTSSLALSFTPRGYVEIRYTFRVIAHR
ncbi:MAG: hypothetical protein AB7S26_27680 [Sandaracinaceae bacterium]